MKNNYKLSLDSISNIDEKIIDEVTDKKIHLLQKASVSAVKARKKLIAIGSIAASFVLIFSVLLAVIIPLLNSSMPVYKGMTIRKGSSASISTQNYAPETYGYTLLSTTTGNNPDNKNKDLEDLVGIDVITDNAVKYYVKPGETFIIEIHIDNPKDYEIQSFTLNGEKYVNYMFKEGSTMELLLLEVTAPSEPGYAEYTIDAIKYIDKTEIKDVDMSSGNKSVKVGVGYTAAPTAIVSNVVVKSTSISFSVDISDPQALASNYPIKAYLSDGETIVASQQLSLGNNQVSFDSLIRGKTYEYGILATYDYVDGSGMKAHWLHTAYATTKAPYISVKNVLAQGNEINFDIILDDSEGIALIEKIELYNGDQLLQVATSTGVRSFTENITKSNYIIKVSYSYDSGNGEKTHVTTEGYPEYSITYHLNGGLLDQPVSSFTWNDLPVKLDIPSQKDMVFDGWYLDKAYTIPLSNSKITMVGNIDVYAKWNKGTDGLIFAVADEEDHVIVKGYEGLGANVVIPDSYLGLPVTEIGIRAFYDNYGVVSVTMGSGIKSINTQAFSNMSNLNLITIGANVTSIGVDAFSNCPNLLAIIIPDRVTTIGKRAFANCENLMHVTIGSSVELIDENAFHYCQNLKEVYNKSELTITAGSSQHGGIGRFAYNIYTPSSGDCKVYYIENNCLFYGNDNTWTLIRYAGTDSTAVLPGNCKGSSYCIGGGAFFENYHIDSVVIPEGVIGIAPSAFYNVGINSVTIPSTVEYLAGAFTNCNRLKTITFNGTIEQWKALVGIDIISGGNIEVYCTDGIF